MKGNLARSSLCSFVTSVDFGLYSWIVGARCDCCVRAIRGHSSAEQAASTLSKAKIVRQDFIPPPPVSKSQIIPSHVVGIAFFLTVAETGVDSLPIGRYFCSAALSSGYLPARPERRTPAS